MRLDICHLIELVEINKESVAYHLMNGFIIAKRAVVTGDDAGIRS